VRFLIIILLIVGIGTGYFYVKNNKLKIKKIRNVEVLSEDEKIEGEIYNLYETALTYIQAGEYGEAERVWRKMLFTYPKSKYTGKAYYELGKYYNSKNRVEVAIKYLNKLIAEYPDHENVPYAYFELANIEEKNGNTELALKKYKKIKEDYFFLDIIEDVSNKIGELNLKLIFSRSQTKFSIVYDVKSGDNLYGIAKKFNTTIDYLIEANNLSKKGVIHPGNKLKILDPKIKFSILIDKSQKTLFLMMNGEIIKKYRIAIGRDDKTTEGIFVVQSKLKDPVWFNAGIAISPDDPRNILGSRWIGFNHDLGIHGTIEDTEITQQSTSGCIRMYNKDVEQLYKLLIIGDSIIIER
jgi:L,D-transpeptidase ErfK/SrfK